MKKILSYCLFGSRNYDPSYEFEMRAYIRGFVWNCKMNKLIFPGYETHVELSADVYSMYDPLFRGLMDYYGVTFNINREDTLCGSMLWRMKVIFKEDSHYVFCRDADAITTYREAQACQDFIDSGLYVHGITDNPAHGTPLLGGMCGFKAEVMRAKYLTYDNLLSLSKIGISARGSDQTFLNTVVYPDFKDSMMGHYIAGMKANGEHTVRTDIPNNRLESVDPKLWEANLTCRHIGSAGVVELEVLRFLKRFSKDIPEFIEIEKKYPQIFYWQLP